MFLRFFLSFKPFNICRVKNATMPKRPFVLNDSNEKNSFGFYVLTSGISLTRFTSNPVMLNNHQNNTKDVLGKWVDVTVENELLKAIPEFDTEDIDGKEVVRKVLKGTIKGCSIGIIFKKDDLKLIEGKLVLTKCILFEASIVAVPSNANAIALYNPDGELLSQDTVQQMCLSIQNQEPPKNNTTMKLLTKHLQLEENADESAILSAVQAIETAVKTKGNEYDALKLKYDALEQKETTRLQKEYDTEKALALTDGRLDAAGETALASLAENKLDAALAFLKALPKRKSISDDIDDPNTLLASFEKMSWDELDKGGLLAQLKAEHEDYYKERFKKEFPNA